MFKNISLILVLILTLNSCTKDVKKVIKNDSYFLSISVESGINNIVYLQKLANPSEIDSAEIEENGMAVFKGSIQNPERYLITIEGLFGGKMIIIENDSITVDIKNKDLINSTIIGSKLNDELFEVQKKSERIYNKIDVLFPDMQRARLENDVEKLQEITRKMTLIEQENIDFNFNYAKENPNSFISAMILSDLSKRDSIDTKKIIESYNTLTDKVKKGIDAQNIELFLKGLH
ncbi:MAG: DUF4369 domain-containing protein [Flavobacteriaceae bacterium]|nr:DUF4369 domain-containing protein [Flavobacteriaceae bacterium]